LEAGDEAKKRGLSAAGGAKQGEEFVLADGDGHIVQGPDSILPGAKHLGDAFRFYGRGRGHHVPRKNIVSLDFFSFERKASATMCRAASWPVNATNGSLRRWPMVHLV